MKMMKAMTFVRKIQSLTIAKTKRYFLPLMPEAMLIQKLNVTQTAANAEIYLRDLRIFYCDARPDLKEKKDVNYHLMR